MEVGRLIWLYDAGSASTVIGFPPWYMILLMPFPEDRMPYFLCKLTLPRPDFVQTMSEDEKRVMKAHGDYLQSLAELGSIVCHGPVDDPKGGWGLSIFDAAQRENVEALTASDPIILDDIGARYEILPMRQLRMKTVKAV